MERYQEELISSNKALDDYEKLLTGLCADKNRVEQNIALRESKEKLILFVGRANGLDKAATNINGQLDTYVSVFLDDMLIYKSSTITSSSSPIYNDNHHVPLNDDRVMDIIHSNNGWLTFCVMLEEPGEDLMLGRFRVPVRTLTDQNQHEFAKGLLSDDEGNIIDETVFLEVQVTLV